MVKMATCKSCLNRHDCAREGFKNSDCDGDGYVYDMESGVIAGQHTAASPLSRTGLSEFMTKSAEDMKQLFQYKNTDYGADTDAFANFRKTAQRVVIPWVRRLCGVEVSEMEAMFLVLMVLQDKHLVALSQTGIDGHEVADGKAMKENG